MHVSTERKTNAETKESLASRGARPHTDLQRRAAGVLDRPRRPPTQAQPNGDPPVLTLWGEEA